MPPPSLHPDMFDESVHSDRRSLLLGGQNRHALWVELDQCGLVCGH